MVHQATVPDMQVLDPGANYQEYVKGRRAYVEALIAKWEWFLGSGTKKNPLVPIPERLHAAMAILFENQSIVSAGAHVLEQTMTTDVAMPVKYALPIVRQVYPQLILSKIASIQPMPLTSGGVMQIFYQNYYREDVTPNTNLTTPNSGYAFKGENEVPNRLKMIITSETVTATKDILGASWSTEVQEDAQGALNIDVGASLVQNCAEEILREIEQRCIMEILNGATAGNVTWSSTVPAAYTKAKDWYETLHHSFIDAQSLIWAQRYRKADWIIGGDTLISYAMKAATFVPAERMTPPGPQVTGVEYVGRVVGFWDLYLTPYITQDRGIMGIYPRSVTDTGYVFAPYIPLAPMPLVYAEYAGPSDPTMPGAYKNVDKWSRNVRTRSAKKMVVPQMYATLTIT